MASATDTIRHYLATLAYRLQTAVRGAPAGFGGFEAGHGVRTPHEIVHHMNDALTSAHRHVSGTAHTDPQSDLAFDDEISRFHELLARVDGALVEHSPEEDILRKVFQGPLSDAMTHVGQIAMLRRMAGSSVRGQNFMAANVRIGRVGDKQSGPRKPSDK